MLRKLKIWKLGLTNFDTANVIQAALARSHLDKISKGQDNPYDTLLLLEHKPVYTVGIRDQISKTEVAKLKDLGAEFKVTNRGGLITFHGPGQLVAYPILNLKHYQPSVKWYVNALEEAVIKMCQQIGIKSSRSPHTGVWVGDNKIAAIGIHASRYVTTHGIAINCNIDLSWFDHIVPCGIEDKSVTSITKELGEDVTTDDISPIFIKKFEEHFNCKSEPIDHDLQEMILKTVYQNLMTVKI